MRTDDGITYWSWDDEPGEEVPDAIERGGDDGGDVVARRQADGHHAVECEVEEGEVHEEEVPEELGRRPFEPDHRVHYDPVYGGLGQGVWEFNGNLQRMGPSVSVSLVSQTVYEIQELVRERATRLSKCVW